VFYSVVYTLILKPNTVQKHRDRRAAGARSPPLIGWAAVTGEIGGGGLLLALVIFLWTPAHFYNLALAYKDDYERGGFPMMPVVRGGRRRAGTSSGTSERRSSRRSHSRRSQSRSAHSTPSWVSPSAPCSSGWSSGSTTSRLRTRFRAFHASNAYLGLLLFAVVFDALVV